METSWRLMGLHGDPHGTLWDLIRPHKDLIGTLWDFCYRSSAVSRLLTQRRIIKRKGGGMTQGRKGKARRKLCLFPSATGTAGQGATPQRCTKHQAHMTKPLALCPGSLVGAVSHVLPLSPRPQRRQLGT